MNQQHKNIAYAKSFIATPRALLLIDAMRLQSRIRTNMECNDICTDITYAGQRTMIRNNNTSRDVSSFLGGTTRLTLLI